MRENAEQYENIFHVKKDNEKGIKTHDLEFHAVNPQMS